MGRGQRSCLAPDRTYVGCSTSVKAAAFVEHAAAHCVAFNVVVVTVDECVLFFEFFFGKFGVRSGICFLEVFAYLEESVFACVFVAVAFVCNGVSLVVAFLAALLAQFLVVCLVAVFAFNVCAQFFREFFLQAAHRFDCFVRSFERSEEVLFGNLVHLAFDHHDVFLGSSDHDVHVGFLELLVGGVDNIFAVYACHAHFGYGAFKRYVGASECSRSGKAGKRVGNVHTVGREKHDVHIYFGVII